MTLILKRGAGEELTRVRALTEKLEVPAQVPNSAELLIAELQRSIAEKDAGIASVKRESEAACRRAREAGWREGRKAAEDHEQQRVAMLAAAFERATARLDEELEATEQLAAAIARACLAKLFANENRDGIVVGLIAAQFARLRSAAGIRVEVARVDFPGEAELQQLNSIGVDRASVVVRDDLREGDCELVAELGRIRIGFDQQWGELNSSLAGFAGEETTA